MCLGSTPESPQPQRVDPGNLRAARASFTGCSCSSIWISFISERIDAPSRPAGIVSRRFRLSAASGSAHEHSIAASHSSSQSGPECVT